MIYRGSNPKVKVRQKNQTSGVGFNLVVAELKQICLVGVCEVVFFQNWKNEYKTNLLVSGQRYVEMGISISSRLYCNAILAKGNRFLVSFIPYTLAIHASPDDGQADVGGFGVLIFDRIFLCHHLFAFKRNLTVVCCCDSRFLNCTRFLDILENIFDICLCVFMDSVA